MAPPPVVTGLSPNDGPPGTRITIRGENFGTRATDLIGLTICGYDCLLTAEWKSPSKIIAISGPGKGLGDVIVSTKLGGVGTCNVKFKGYKNENIGPMKDSAVWVEETSFYPWDRHSLSSSSFQQDDPLGLSVEGTERKLTEDDLNEKFPNTSGDITAENFSASWFLLENHLATSFNDLQAGLLHLKRKVEGQKEGHLSFLKTNVGAVMDQVDTLMVLKEKYEKDVNMFGSEPTLKLEKAIKGSEREARKLYDDVLARRDRAEKTRNALNVLSRFKFLFCLPCSIARNIKKGDYDIIINDYMRVKNLFLKRDIPVFKMALNVIEQFITGIKEQLHTKLVKMPINVEEQKRLIKYLINLDTNYEPAWDAINGRAIYLHNLMKQCYEEDKAAILEDLNKSKNSHLTSKYSKYTTLQETNPCPQNVFYVEEMCDIISELFPDIWKLGQAYFVGELHVKVEPGHKTAFKHMVLNIMEVFCKRLRAAIIPHTLDKNTDRTTYEPWALPDIDLMAIYLPDCLRYVRYSYAILVKLDLPSEALDIVLAFIMDLRIHCMCILFKKTTDNVKQFSKQEKWKIEISESYSGITELPLKFEQSVQDLIQVISDSILKSELREGSLLENPLAQKEFDKQIEILLATFYMVLDSLTNKGSSDDDDDENRSPIVSQLIGTPSSMYRLRSHSQKPAWEHRLLMTLANCQYTTNVVLKNIVEAFLKNGYSISPNIIRKSKMDLENLERSILESYLEQKSDPLVGTIEPSMYLGRFDWDTKVAPTDLRPYAKECINNLIHVHFEVNSISAKLIDSVLPQVVQTIAEELYRLMSCVQKFSIHGIQQAHIDISALQEFFSAYSTPKAKDHFKEAMELIPPLEQPDLTIVEDILQKCRTKMRLQILCLQKS
ncbi:hypothetical protein Trydic_g13367 [Trypoxylus dichotomus]